MNNNIEKIELHSHLKESYLSYSMAVIVDRAIPDVRDGLLPVHRRILYSMNNKGITHNKPFAKSSEPVAETMKIHAHGDSSTYMCMALLTDRNEGLLHPYLEGDGSFGKVYSTDSPSHMRYTFCRLSEFAEEMFYGLKKGAVKIIGEDGHYQPVVLSSTYPNILVKPNNAIAVGQACSFGSFPLHEVCNVTSAYIDNKDIVVSDYLTPDFSTGGRLIYDKAQLDGIYETGKGKITLRSKYIYNEKENMIEIYEIPYTTTAQKIIETVIEKINKFKAITDIRDETGFNKEKNIEELKICIDVKKGTDVEVLMAQLFKETSLEDSFSFNMNCLVDNRPKVLGIKPILDEWLSFRRSAIRNVMKYDIDNKAKELHLLIGLEKILINIDRAVEIIRYESEDKVITSLSSEFGIDERQAEYVVNMKLRNINKDYIYKETKRITDMKLKLEEMKFQMDSEEHINSIIKEELERVKEKFGRERRTEIVEKSSITTVKKVRAVEEYTATLVLTKEMYFKKCRRYASEDKHRVKDGDSIIKIGQCSNAGKVMFLTSLGNTHIINIDDFEEKTPTSIGLYLPNIIKLETDEIIIGMVFTDDYKGHVLIMYENAKLAKVPFSSYNTNRAKLANCISKENGAVIMIAQSKTDVDIRMVDVFGNEKIVNTANINDKKSRDTVGVKAWNSSKKGFKIKESFVA